MVIKGAEQEENVVGLSVRNQVKAFTDVRRESQESRATRAYR